MFQMNGKTIVVHMFLPHSEALCSILFSKSKLTFSKYKQHFNHSNMVLPIYFTADFYIGAAVLQSVSCATVEMFK